ncbi:hypothetical protein GGI25_002262 [Coemansia spiralis]|uniref:WD40 repeat-like protein n=2 Tax=Coemansia TaxID=4863 RepID=A0A9W8G977_9FUNG|nr:hypothetical protein EDC05_001086 [Coemansia umbellata]KAJ2678468.1 hypothetical protein GGI25_002262 [Coemansia spiralis]
MTSKLVRFTEHVGFPVSCIGVTQGNEIVLGGGGGAGRSGTVYSVDSKKRKLEKTNELELSSDEDAPTCLTMHPKEKVLASSINTSKEQIEKGQNKNCRVFTLTRRAVKPGKTANTICSKSDFDYQKCIAFDPTGKLLAGGATDGTLAVVQYPSLRPEFPFLDATEEINDVCFNTSAQWLAVATDDELKILSTKAGSLVQTIDNPHTMSGKHAVFRFARFGPEKGTLKSAGSAKIELKNVLYTVLNTKSRKQAYITIWDTRNWKRLVTRPVCDSAITTFALSKDGALLAFATASLQIGICDAHSLRILARIQAAHSFAITSLSFDNQAKYLVSGSADETCQIIEIPDKWPTAIEGVVDLVRENLQIIIMLLVLLLAIIFAWLARS